MLVGWGGVGERLGRKSLGMWLLYSLHIICVLDSKLNSFLCKCKYSFSRNSVYQGITTLTRGIYK